MITMKQNYLKDERLIKKTSKFKRLLTGISLFLLLGQNMAPLVQAEDQTGTREDVTTVPLENEIAHTVQTDENSHTVWLVTDIHFMSPSLTDNGKRFEIFQKQAAGIDYAYGPDRMEALIEQVEREQPDAIIVAGDLTSNGEYQSMVDLAGYFARVQTLGTQVFVIPGNHDIHNGWAVHFKGERAEKDRQTSPADFSEIFSEFGYNEALSRDSESLSYLAEITPTFQLLMLDTNVYSKTLGEGQPTSRGQVKTETLRWVRELLSETATGVAVLPVLHHGALSHFGGQFQKITPDQASDFQNILVDYQLPLTLTGHLHSQHIATLWVDETALHEVVTSSFSIYPGKMGAITLDEKGISYQQIALEMDQWFEPDAYQTYLAHLKQLQTNSTHVKIFDTVYNDADLKPHTQEISDVFQQLNLSFFMGSIQEDWPTLEVDLASIEPYIEGSDYRFFNGYLDLLLSTKDYSQTELTIEWAR